MLRKRPILELTALMYVYDSVVSDTIKEHRFAKLKDLLENRMLRNASFFKEQQIISATYWYFVSVK